MNKKIFIIILFLTACLVAGYFVVRNRNKTAPVISTQKQIVVENNNVQENKIPDETSSIVFDTNNATSQKDSQSPVVMAPQKIQQKVPFMVQAPFGNWKDPIFQNACEETSMIMAMGWVNNVSAILSQEAQNQIKAVSAFEDKAFGYNADTDLQDMQKVFQNYFHYQNIKIQENIKMGDIKNEIENGNVVLAPAFGRALKNPNYTAPGPVAHMLVIIGYDPDTQEFITNDSGTRHGAGYRYEENVLFDAIWEYPSGNAVLAAPTGTLKKGMLVIGSK